MMKRFNVGDLVTWNSEAGRVRGTIIKAHQRMSITKDTDDTSKNDPLYENKSAKTDHIAMHKGRALKKTV
jgi:DUF2945 family protein